MELPEGWQAGVWPKRRPEEEATELNLQRVGSVLLPDRFVMGITIPELDEVAVGGEGGGLLVWFRVLDGELCIELVHVANADFEKWFPYVVERFPMDKWKSYATAQMVMWLVHPENRGLLPDLAKRQELWQVKQRPVKPGGSKRYKITEQHLKEVARVYSEAVERGEPPTKEVAEVFEVAHSTAAKWVGGAREKGFLEPVSTRASGNAVPVGPGRKPTPGVDRSFTDEEVAAQPRPREVPGD